MIYQNDVAYKWFDKNGTLTKGYFFYKGTFYKDEQMNDFFASINQYDIFLETMRSINGFFAIVLYRGTKTFIAVDRVRSFPVFYSTDGKVISDSVDSIIKNCSLTMNDIDNTVVCEIMSSGYSQNNDTAYTKVKQLAAGQILEVDSNTIKVQYYFKHTHKLKEYSLEDISSKIEKMSSDIFDRLITSLQGRTVILPLSGGYDSRYIAAMLKKKGYEKVICYTYGQKGSYEVKVSEAVAKTLGYKWYYIEYDEKIWECLLEEDCLNYADSSHNYATIPHFQDYPALKQLLEMNVVPSESIVVTGFCGDLPAGSFVLQKEDEEKLIYEVDWLVDYIFKEHYTFVDLPDKYIIEIKKKIKFFLQEMNEELHDFNSFTSLYEAWFTNSRPIRWVVNSNRLYEFNNLEWRMPLWDNDFIDLFNSLKIDYRRNSYMYEKYLFDKLFVPLNIDFKKPKFVKSKPKLKQKFKQKVKRLVYLVLVRIAFLTGWSSWNYFDVNNYSKAAILLYKHIGNRRLFEYKSINFHQMNSIWWTERVYGVTLSNIIINDFKLNK